jgi:PAS domain S-box-containing protein
LVPVLLCISSTDGYFHRVNPEFTKVLGWSEAEMLSIPYLDLVHPDDVQATLDAVEMQSGGTQARAFVNRYRCKDGTYRWLAWESNPVENEGLMYAMARDVTEQRLAEGQVRAARDEAHRANQAKSEFLSRMSHELRTPLNVVLGFAQLLQLGELSAEEDEAVEHIIKAGRHLLSLIDEVLDISRIESRRLSLSMESVDVHEVAEEVVRLMAPLGQLAEVTVGARGTAGTLHAWADRQRLKQVLLNLVSNGIKYNRPGGAVTVQWARSSEGVRIAVADTGRGISSAGMARLFEPFDRLGAEATGIEGTGLGLALSRALTEAMGGELTATSAPGEGSTFTISIGSAAVPGGHARHEASPPARAPDPAVSGRRVLYIEDNLANLAVVERLLASRPGIELQPAMQGRLGLELAALHHPDLIILDLHLPDISGVDVLAALQADPSLADIPVLIASADATPGQVQRLLDAGARAYLTKPLDLLELLAHIDTLLQ